MNEKIQFGNLSEEGKKKIDGFLNNHKRFMDADDTNLPSEDLAVKDAEGWRKLLSKDTYEEFKHKITNLRQELERLQYESVVANDKKIREIDAEIEMMEGQVKRFLRWLNEMEMENPDIQRKNPGLDALHKKLKGQNARLN